MNFVALVSLCVSVIIIVQSCNKHTTDETEKTNEKEKFTGKVYDLVIIGGGAQAVAILAQFIIQKILIQDGVSFSILIIEKNSKIGHGYAYDGDDLTDQHVLNLPAFAVDITNWCDPVCEDSDFVKWYRIDGGYAAGEVELDDTKQFWFTPKRAIVGKYLEQRYKEYKRLLIGKGFEIEDMTNTAVISAKKMDSGDFSLGLSSTQPVHARDIFVATGHWDKIRRGFEKVNNYLKSPWPVKNLLKKIPENAKVAVLGASQSAGDTALSLAGRCGTFDTDDDGTVTYMPKSEKCKKMEMTMYSRSGKLPTVQGVLSKIKLSNTIMTLFRLQHAASASLDAIITLDFLFEYVLKELKELSSSSAEPSNPRPEDYFKKLDTDTYGHLADPQDPMARLKHDIDRANGSFQTGVPLWPQNFFFDARGWIFNDYAAYFPAEDHIRFWGPVVSSVLKVGLPIPLCNALKLIALMKGGFLDVKSVGKCEWQPQKWKRGVNLKCPDEKKPRSYSHVVDARGQDGLIGNDDSPLTKSLIKNNIVSLHEIKFTYDHMAKNRLDAYGDKIIGTKYKAEGVTIDLGTFQAAKPRVLHGRGAVYVSGPYLFGQIPIPRNLRTVVVVANCAVFDIGRRRFGELMHEDDNYPRYRTCS